MRAPPRAWRRNESGASPLGASRTDGRLFELDRTDHVPAELRGGPGVRFRERRLGHIGDAVDRALIVRVAERHREVAVLGGERDELRILEAEAQREPLLARRRRALVAGDDRLVRGELALAGQDEDLLEQDDRGVLALAVVAFTRH